MVNSILDKSINYPEIKNLDSKDKNFDATAYEVEIFGSDTTIALGQPKYSFIEKNIIYFPIYLVVNDKVDSQIGVYEIFSNTLPNLLDEDGDIDLEKLHAPLIYSYTEDVLKKLNETLKSKSLLEVSTDSLVDSVVPSKIDSVVDSNIDSAVDSNIDSVVDSAVPDKDNWRESPIWIQNYMKSKKYKIIDNEGGGDCLFAAIRDGLEIIGQKITVQEMREQLAGEATQEIFENYKLQYDSFKLTLDELNLELTKLTTRNKELKTLLTNSKDRVNQMAIIKEAKELKENYNSLRSNKIFTMENLDEFKFMNGINNLAEFKKLIKSCTFWGETWALSTLERVLNIKLVLFSHESWVSGDINNVLHCGQLNDDILEQIGVFEPSHYILLDYNGWHYKLITYEDKGALTFGELSKDIKDLIKDKCLERNAGPYYLIPQFKSYKNIESELYEIDPAQHDDKTVLQIYNLSEDKLPGKGVGEKITPGRENEFSELSKIKNWRRKLTTIMDSDLDNIKQTPDMRELLLKTNDATIQLFRRSDPPVILKSLHSHRQSLQKLSRE